MDTTTVVSALVGAVGALAPAIFLITSHYKKLRDDVMAAKAEAGAGVVMLKAEFSSGFQLMNQKIAAIERQISDQQKHLTKIHDDHVRLAERMAVVETKISSVEGDVSTLQKCK